MGGQRLYVLLAIVALASGFQVLGGERAALGSRAGAEQEGGIFRISLNSFSGIDYMDPALASSPPGWALLDTTCARLLAYPDKPPPEGFRLQPEVATGFPAVSRDGRTYTFRLRSGFRFSDGTPVRASAFARAINRALAPEMNSPGVQYVRDIVGAGRVLAGKSVTATGVVARGNTLVVRLDAACAGLPAPDGLDVLLCRAPGTARSTPKDAAPSRQQAPTTSPSTGEASGSCFDGTRTTEAGDRITSRASTSTSVPHRPRRCCSASIETRPTGGTPSPGSTSIRLSVSRREVRDQSLAAVPQAWTHAADARVQLGAASVPQQPESAQGGQLRPRPAGARRQFARESPQRPVPPLHPAGIQG